MAAVTICSDFGAPQNKSATMLLLIIEMQIKTAMDITSHHSEWSSSKSLQTKNAGKGVEKREQSCTVGGKVNLYSHYGRQHGVWNFSLKTRNKTTI